MKKRRITILLGVGIAVALLLIGSFFVSGFHRYHRVAPHGPFAAWHQMHNRRFTADNVDLIRDWMSFDYLNWAFQLPNDYLQVELKIDDTDYPHVSVRSMAEKERIASSVYLHTVQVAIIKYFAQNPSQ